MKVTVVGIETMSGISKKTNNAYNMGRIHALCKLDDTPRAGVMIKGSAGTTYDVAPDLVDRIKHLPLPFEAEFTFEDVMRYGKRESKLVECMPIQRVTPPVQPVRAA